MKTLERLFRKNKKLVVGLMSGTSADGIDAALVEIRGSGTKSAVKLIAFETYSYPRGFKEFLLKNSNATTAQLDEIARLDMLIAQLFAEAVRKIVRKSGKRMSAIDLIGSHGQTIHHLPILNKLFGHQVRSTMQIGNPSIIAKLTGVVTVGDFRVGDVAVGGTGAPLVPLFDFLMLRSDRFNRGILNIGGIANLTILPKKCSLDNVVAFDTGPGNMLIDYLAQKLFRRPFDEFGMIALKGKINPSLLKWMIEHPYLKQPIPKSTGREMFGEEFARNILKRSRNFDRKDIITTVTEFTALSIYHHYIQFIQPRTKIQELIVSGGGVKNIFIMNSLQRYFGNVRILTSDEMQIPSDAKEAICFALLANETISGNHGNIPNATGAQRSTSLGVIALP